MIHSGTLSQYTRNKVQLYKVKSSPRRNSFSGCYQFGLSTLLFPVLTLLCTTVTQSRAQNNKSISLAAALQIASENNKSIQRSRIEKDISEEEIKEKKELRIPEVDFHASYARITDLTEFRHGLGDKVVTNTIPVIADVTGSAKLPLYTGGRIKYSIMKAGHQYEMASLQLEKADNDIRIEVTALFLQIYKMMELDKLIQENIREEEDRLREVKAFKAHGTVTRNEVLRAELQLSNMQLSLMTNHRNTDVVIHELQTLLELPEENTLQIDTAQILSDPIPVAGQEMYMNAALSKDEMRMSQKMEDILITERRITKAAFYPNLQLFASYGFNYPNYMFFPPDPYLYTLGRVGIEATYSLSNLYKNKTRMHIAHKRIEAQHVQTDLVRNQVRDHVYKQYSELEDIRETIPVREKALVQATENYRIVKVKYLNQLALITEMIDADTALLQARFDIVSARIDTVMKYRQLLYASGLLQ